MPGWLDTAALRSRPRVWQCCRQTDRHIRCSSPAPALHAPLNQHTESGPPALDSRLAQKAQAQGFLKPQTGSETPRPKPSPAASGAAVVWLWLRTAAQPRLSGPLLGAHGSDTGHWTGLRLCLRFLTAKCSAGAKLAFHLANAPGRTS